MAEAVAVPVGTDQIIKALDVLIEGGNVADAAAHDQGNAIAKLSHLTKLLDEVMALGSFSAPALVAQIKDLSSEEKAQIVSHFKAKLDLANDVLEAKIEAGLDLLIEVVTFAESGVALVKKVGAAFKPAEAVQA